MERAYTKILFVAAISVSVGFLIGRGNRPGEQQPIRSESEIRQSGFLAGSNMVAKADSEQLLAAKVDQEKLSKAIADNKRLLIESDHWIDLAIKQGILSGMDYYQQIAQGTDKDLGVVYQKARADFDKKASSGQ